MLVDSLSPPAVFPLPLHEPLRAHGLVRDGKGCLPPGVSLGVRGRWYVFEVRAVTAAQMMPAAILGTPGLWKQVPGAQVPSAVFEIPAWVVSVTPEEDRLDESGPVDFRKLLDWMLATRSGRVSPGWAVPEKALLEPWLGPSALTVQAKEYVRQVELIQDGPRWALRVPILTQCPEGLPDHRRIALGRLIADVQRRWAMVRFGFCTGSPSGALLAEVDFSGAPHSGLLFSAGREALRNVASLAVETAEVLANPAIEIACLALGEQHKATSQERKIE